MAFFSGSIRSQALKMDTHIQVILPYDRPIDNQQTPCKVLYLLHGMNQDSTAWIRNSLIERYAKEYGIAVVMPEVQRSFYVDMTWGLDYFTYVSKELPEICGQMFHISKERQDTFVAGLSMGGYGAFRCALTCPEQYAAAASFSGAIDLEYMKRELTPQGEYEELKAVFGLDLELKPKDDLLHLAEQVSKLSDNQKPRLLMTCGRQDFLYHMNVRVREYLSALPLDFTWKSWDGEHDWKFWEPSLGLAFSFFFNEK